MRNYGLMTSQGLDTYTGYDLIGVPRDIRIYDQSAAFIEMLGAKNILLHTNSPEKERRFGSLLQPEVSLKLIQTQNYQDLQLHEIGEKYLKDKKSSGHNINFNY